MILRSRPHSDTACLKETEGQVVRLEEVASILKIKPDGKKCMGIEGVIK